VIRLTFRQEVHYDYGDDYYNFILVFNLG